ncbi:MAG: hypothetical protein L3V56_08320 [Candidatus Magnetoovum sp. WYHC-5]|nr:hypothetical protein [Candidatus Magnetoovum sp. WYHC-5]
MQFKKEKDTPTSASQPLSEQLVDKLLPLTNQPRPDDFIKFTEDALLLLGIIPSINGQFITTTNMLLLAVMVPFCPLHPPQLELPLVPVNFRGFFTVTTLVAILPILLNGATMPIRKPLFSVTAIIRYA